MAYGRITSSGGRELNLTPAGWINNEGENLNAAPGNALAAALAGQALGAQQQQQAMPAGNTLADLLMANNTSYKNKVNYNGREAFMTPDGSIVWQNADGSTGKAQIRSPAQDAFERDQLARAKERVALDQATANLEQTREQAQQMRTPSKPAWEIIDTEQGKMRVDKNSGRMEPLGVASAEKPVLESQAKGAGFAARAADAHRVLDQIGKGGQVQPGMIKRAAESMPLVGGGLGTMANWTQSGDQQQVEQAQRNFVNAIMRQESGAAIGQGEFDSAAKQYFPQPGDTPQVVAQKAQNRERAISALEAQAGPALKKVLRPGGTGTPANALPTKNAQGWMLHQDAAGRRAYVGPNGEIQEVG